MALLRLRNDPSLTGGSVCHIAFLRLRFGSRKQIGKGVLFLALLRGKTDPSLGKDVSGMALLRTNSDLSRKLVEKGAHGLVLLRAAHVPSLTGGSVHYMA